MIDGEITLASGGNTDYSFNEFHLPRLRANNQSFTMVSSWIKFAEENYNNKLLF